MGSQMEGLFQNLGTYSEIPGTTIQEGVSDFIFHSATVLNAFAIEKEREVVLEELKLNRLEALVDFLHNLILDEEQALTSVDESNNQVELKLTGSTENGLEPQNQVEKSPEKESEKIEKLVNDSKQSGLNDEKFDKFSKMVMVGIPKQAVLNKMAIENFTAEEIEKFSSVH